MVCSYILYSFIQQQTSWSALQVPTGAVQQLLTAYSVSPIFLEALYSFGTKVTGDDDPHFAFSEERYNSSLKIRGKSMRTRYPQHS